MTCCSSLRKTVLRAKRLACRRVLTLSLVATVTSGLRVALCSRTPRFCELVLLFGLRSLVVFSPFWASSPKSAFGNTLSWGSCLLFRGRDPQGPFFPILIDVEIAPCGDAARPSTSSVCGLGVGRPGLPGGLRVAGPRYHRVRSE